MNQQTKDKLAALEPRVIGEANGYRVVSAGSRITLESLTEDAMGTPIWWRAESWDTSNKHAQRDKPEIAMNIIIDALKQVPE